MKIYNILYSLTGFIMVSADDEEDAREQVQDISMTELGARGYMLDFVVESVIEEDTEEDTDEDTDE